MTVTVLTIDAETLRDPHRPTGRRWHPHLGLDRPGPRQGRSAAGRRGSGGPTPAPAAKTVIDDDAGRRGGRVGEILAVPAQHEAMVRACRNLGRPGVAACAISAVDIALWDLKARSLGLPLSDLFGPARPEVPIYGSGGFTTYDDPPPPPSSRSGSRRDIPGSRSRSAKAWGTHPERDLAPGGPRPEGHRRGRGAVRRRQRWLHPEAGPSDRPAPGR